MLTRQGNLLQVLVEVILREGVDLDLARAADGYADAPHSLGLDALHVQGDQLQTQVLHSFFVVVRARQIPDIAL